MTPHQLLDRLAQTLFQTTDTETQREADFDGVDMEKAADQRKIQEWRTAARTGVGLR